MIRISALALSFWVLSAVAVAAPGAPNERVACPETPTAYDANPKLVPGTDFTHQEVVTLRVLIDPDGHVVDATVVQSTNSAFNGASIAAVRKWKYRKHEVHDEPACIQAVVEIKFDPSP